MAMSEACYTLTEAARLLARATCRSEGHTVLWIPFRQAGSNETRYGCTRCSAQCTVWWGRDAADITLPSYEQMRILALRDYCLQPGQALKRGHDLIPVSLRPGSGYGVDYVCRACDAVAHFELEDSP